MIKKTSNRIVPSFALMSAFLTLTACTTTPEPVVEAPAVVRMEDMTVQIYTPEPVPEPVTVPSIDIAEYERQQAEAAAALRAAEEALRPAPAPAIKPAVKKTLEQRLGAAKTADSKIAILKKESTSGKVSKLLASAYKEKLAADKASGNDSGAAEALVYLGQLDAKDGARDDNMSALKKYAEALKLNPNNSEAPRLVSQMRDKLQSYSDSLHKAAVSYFVDQNFSPAISRWEKVLLIDPGNNAARNWYNQAIEAVKR